MITFFVILLLAVCGQLIGLALRAAWGITKIVFTIGLLPVILIIMVIMGLTYFAIPILLVIGVASLIKLAVK